MKLIATLIICSFSLGVFAPVLARGGDIDLTIEGGVLSARLKEAPLKIILERLERETGTWFRGDPSVLEEEVTVQFTELPLEEGLKRILSSMNYSLIYDSNEKPVGVIFIGKGKAGPGMSEGRGGGTTRTILPPARDQADASDSFTVIKNVPPPGGNVEITAEEHENFRVMRNSSLSDGPVEVTGNEPENFTVIRNLSPPGGPVEVSAEELENFKVIRNLPPPGGPVEVTEQEPENFTVMRNLPPPGGPVEVSTEELENFRVIRNLPPPGS
jgi:hypothetical protein